MVRTRLFIRAWALTIGLSGCAHFSAIEDVPVPYLERVASHPVWLTITSFDNARGVFPPAETSVIKKWSASRTASGEVVLNETASSSFFGLMETQRDGRAVQGRVDLSEAVDPAAFFPFPGHALDKRRRFASDRYEFKDIDGKRFQIRINGGGRIVFAPAPKDSFNAGNPHEIPSVGVWATPFGAEGELVAHLQKLMRRDAKKERPAELPEELRAGVFLHHDLTVRRQIAVTVDPTFPAALRPAVVKAAAKWNQALGKDLFTVAPKVEGIHPADCLSGRKLCVRWIGRPEVVMTGANGYTELAFDPQTGLILGGVISIINDDVRPPFSQLPALGRRKLAQLDRDWISDAMHRFHGMNAVLHPEPLRYAEYLVLHEMGHFNGLGHNFYTSAQTTPARPVSSVMSYPPFPVAHRANYIGDADLQRLAIVYKQAKPAEALSYCSTFDAMAPDREERGYYRKSATCDMFTLGDGADWYIRLARRGKQGVFTPFPDLGHLSEDLQALYLSVASRHGLPPLNVLTRLGFILADESAGNSRRRQRISGFLCGMTERRDEIGDQLKTFHGVKLRCRGRPDS